jgi:hypothetical protein
MYALGLEHKRPAYLHMARLKYAREYTGRVLPATD